jgi:hypothetical protein
LPAQPVAAHLRQRLGAAVLDVLGPPGGEHAEGVPGGDHDVHLGRGQGLDEPARLLAAGAAHELVGEDRGAGVAVDGLDQPGQGAGRLRVAPLEVRPLLELEGRPQVLAMAPTREEVAVARERGLGVPEHGLQVGSAGLGQTDVEEDLRRHVGWART